MYIYVIFLHALSLGLSLMGPVAFRPRLGPGETETLLLLSKITLQVGETDRRTRSSNTFLQMFSTGSYTLGLSPVSALCEFGKFSKTVIF